MEEKIFVIYAGVQGLRSEDIEVFVKKLGERIVPSIGETIIIPTQSPNTTLECINPVYIMDTELIAEHTELMKKLNEQLQIQLEQLKKENNE